MLTGENFLYILIFENGKYFKLGYTIYFERVEALNKIYKFDLNKSFIISDKNKINNVRKIENKIKKLIPERCNDFFLKDGWSEIRSIKHLDTAIQIINESTNYLHEKIYISTILDAIELEFKRRKCLYIIKLTNKMFNNRVNNLT